MRGRVKISNEIIKTFGWRRLVVVGPSGREEAHASNRFLFLGLCFCGGLL
jgi:hypothetical protein